MINSLRSSIYSYFKPTFDWIPQRPTIIECKAQPNSFLYDGKLMLRQEISLDEMTFNQLLSTDNFKPVQSIEKYFWGYRCRRCGNQVQRLFANLPCKCCNSTHVYCRNCIEMGRVMLCQPLYVWTGISPVWPKHDEPCRWKGELTPHQQQASDLIKSVMNQKNGELLVWAVCGAGKTEMVFGGIESLLRQGKRVCLATPRADVVRELLPRFREAFPEIDIQGLYGGSPEKDKPGQLVLSTTHQLLRYAYAFDAMIIDEIDAFPFHNDPSLLFAARRAIKPDAPTIYLTATPRRIHKRRIESNKLPVVFVPVRFHGHPLPIPTLKMCFSLKKSLQSFQFPSTFFRWYSHLRVNKERQLLIFVPTVDIAEKLTEALLGQLEKSGHLGLSVSSVHASDPDRSIKVQQFRNRKLSILITTTILERGVTFPSVDVVVIDAGHHVFDEAALVQISGRAGRSPKDPNGEVIFYHDGKSEAMVQAVKSIKEMNKRGRNM